ncbi:outer membrane beta-barrel protein [Aquiflexum sp.]|uniref:outer membrane beta-barrel protein n=1 Tax=Aquiflexum sp. TaxID=1872584 RepID=UPI0035941956
MKKSLFIILLILLVFKAYSQHNINGMVTDQSNNPIVFANILLLNPSDSMLIKGAVSDNEGAYRLENVPEGKYLLNGYMMGYRKVFIPIVINGRDLEAPLLSLEEELEGLEEVLVEAKRPLIEQDNFKTVVNVANCIVATGSTALEILEKAPGVRVDRQNDGISLMGRDQVMVQINGKQTYMAMADVVALLRSMPSDNIDKIELITNPSAKEDAQGNSGIINIILQKNDNVGTNGSASLTGGSGRYGRSNGSLQLNHRTKKMNFFGNISGLNNRSYWDFNLSRDQADGELRNLVDQHAYIRFKSKGGNAKTGIDYFPNDRTTIGIVWTGFWNNTLEESPAFTTFRRMESNPPYFQQFTDKTLSNVSSNHLVNLNFQYQFAKSGSMLSADFDRGIFNRDFSNDLITSTLIPENPDTGREGLFTEMPTQLDILTFKVDYQQPIGNWKMESGYKMSEVRSDNNMTLSRGPMDDIQIDPLLSNHFRYLEIINALYVSFSGSPFADTELQVGLRAEHTKSNARSLNLKEEVPRDYLDLFPTFFISREISEKQRLSFSYGYRIVRPNYQSLNPGRSYLDPYAFQRGNPFLTPEYTHTLELKHAFDNKIFTALGANYISDIIIPILQPVDHQTAERNFQNFGTSQLYNLNISFPIDIMNNWTMQTTLLGVYNGFQFVFLGSPMEAEQFSGRINGMNSIMIGKGWSAEITGWLSAPTRQAFITTPWLGSLDLGLQKSIGENWKTKLIAQDIFYTNRYVGVGTTPDFVQNYHILFDSRVVLLNLSYTFGNQQLKKARQRKTGAEEEMKRSN